ncbi:MAG: TIGR03857 family LLM class F420-dependent oxidoreductase [Microthrixaceae bacterium]
MAPPDSHSATTPPATPELGCYLMAGAAADPAELIREAREAERMGLGTAFISERFNVKEAIACSGAAVAATERLRVATAATNHNTRHPLVTASAAMTLHRMSGHRFVLGLGRGIDPVFDIAGIPRITTAQMEDFVGIMARLWRGEMVAGHDGPAGSWPLLHLGSPGGGVTFDDHIPMLLCAFGPNSLALAGRCFDEVVLHTFFTDGTTERVVGAVRDAAEQAGRDPSSVRIWSCLATVGDHLDEATRLRKTVGRMATYLQGYGDLMVRTNDWDPAMLERFRSDPTVGSFLSAIDASASTEQLEAIAQVIPEEWLAPSATGTAQQCADTVRAQFDLGVDGVIMHGCTPAELAPVHDAYVGGSHP